MKSGWHVAIAMFAGVALTAGDAPGQPYPNKPIRMIQGFAAGGGADFTGRLVGNEMSKRMGQPIIHENRTGAGGTIAAQAVAKSAPDGYTLFYGDIVQMNPIFMENNTVVMSRDLIPVSAVASGGFLLVTTAKLPVRSFAELIAHSKANPGKLNFGSPTVITSVMMQVLRERTAISYTDIPYKGGPALLLALLAGDADFAFVVLPGIPAQLQSGTLLGHFFTGGSRSSLLPNIPTAAELGIKDFSVQINFGIWAPPGTPKEIVERLSNEAAAVMKSPQTAEQFRKGPGYEVMRPGPEEQARIYEADLRFWSEATRLAKFKPQ